MKTKKNLLKIFGVMIILIFIFSACQKKWLEPDRTNPSSGWKQDGYTLTVNNKDAQIVADTGYVPVGVNFEIEVINSSGNVVQNVIFNFGDGSPTVTGSQVIHKYANLGLYPLSAAVPDGPTFNKFMRAVPFGPSSSDVVIQIHHLYSNGICYDTIGLNVANISGYSAPGTYFVSGDFNGWPSPPNALALYQTRAINGQTYVIWPIQHAVGLEKFNHGKNFTGGGYAYNYSPNDPYWHITNPPNGELWIYFTVTGISPTPNMSTMPGLWGDSDPNTWIYRGECTAFNPTTANVTLYVNKTAGNPNNPNIYYSLNSGANWVNYPWIEQGDYYKYTIVNVPYSTIIYFYSLFQAGNQSSKVAGGVMYNSITDCCLIQISNPFQSKSGNQVIYGKDVQISKN